MNKHISIRLLVILPALALAAFAFASADLGALAQNTNNSSAVDPSEGPAGATRGAQDNDTGVNSPGEATDLSGTYNGRVRMAGGHEMNEEGSLTITGNQFTLTAGGMTHSGRVIAITTRGYTGATFWISDQTDSATNTTLAFSVRVRRGRNNITITPVPGARNRFWFNGRAG